MEPFQLGTEWTEDGPGGAGRCRRTWCPLSLPALDALLSGAAFPSRRIYSVACTREPRDGLLQASVVLVTYLAFAPRACLGFVPSILFPSVVGSVRFVNGF